MLSIRRIAPAIAVLALSSALVAPAQAVAPAALGNDVCDAALTSLGKVQVKKAPSSALLDQAIEMCGFSNPQFPIARFATVTFGKRTIGGVFAVENANTLVLANQPNVTGVLLNGHGLNVSKSKDRYFVKGKTVTVTLGDGKKMTGTMQANIGDGGSFIKVKTSGSLGSESETLTESASNPTPQPGTPVVVYTERGPVKTTIGEPFKGKWASIEGVASGTVVRAADGAVIGTAGEFGTGLDAEESKFWKDRSYFTPLF